MSEVDSQEVNDRKPSLVRRLAIGCGVVVLLLICLGGVAVILGNRNGDDTAEPAATQAVAESAEEAAVEVVKEPEEVDGEPAGEEATAEPAPPTATTGPTNTPQPANTPQPTATPTPLPEGLSRSNPYTNTVVVNSPNWDVEVLEIIRGDEAWNRLQATNQFNDPPPDGMEYLLLNIHAKSTYADDAEHSISGSDFKVTGDRFQCYSHAIAVDPEPELDARVTTGGEATGWVSFLVGTDESNLVLVIDELLNFDDDRFRYIVLEPDASLSVDPSLAAITPTDAGRTRQDPLPLNETAIAEDWEITVFEVIRGPEAWSRIQATNSFNEPPADGMEYLLMRVGMRNISTVDEYHFIDEFAFNPTGSAYILHDLPSVVTPDPVLDACLYPGGYAEGWVSMEVYADETDLIAVFEPSFAWFGDESLRHFALEAGATLDIPAELAGVEANDLGEERSDPAPVGETVITDNWEVRVEEVVRGDQAWTMVQEANQFNDPPGEGMEYIAVSVYVRYLGDDEETANIDGFAFNTTGAQNVIYDVPSVVEPEPALDVTLYPGGAYAGWIMMQAAQAEENVILVFDESLFGAQRYLALQP